MKPRYCAVIAVFALAACGSPSPPDEPDAPVEPPESARPTVFDPLTSTLDRAQGVQQTLDEQAAEQRRRLEAQER
jgi:hypothetical protein